MRNNSNNSDLLTPGSPVPGAAAAALRPPRRRLFGRILLSLFVTLISVECGLRILDWRAGRPSDFYLPEEIDLGQSLFEPHPFIGYALKPGFKSRRDDSIHVNSLGMRGREMNPVKPPSVYRILCLGGSTTFGTSVSDDDHTYPAQLEKLLNEERDGSAPHRTYEVGNCGVSGYTTVENLIQLELRLLEYKPDAIILYEGVNDARPVQAQGFRPDYAHLRRCWTQERFSALETFLLRNVRIYCHLTRGTDPEMQVTSLSNHVFVPDFRKLHVRSDQWVNEDGVRIFVRNLRNMITLCRKNSVLPVLSTFALCSALSGDTKDERFIETVLCMNRELQHLAMDEHVPLVDVASEISERRRYFADYMHLNDYGSRRHAEAVFAQARQQQIFR